LSTPLDDSISIRSDPLNGVNIQRGCHVTNPRFQYLPLFNREEKAEGKMGFGQKSANHCQRYLTIREFGKCW